MPSIQPSMRAWRRRRSPPRAATARVLGDDRPCRRLLRPGRGRPPGRLGRLQPGDGHQIVRGRARTSATGAVAGRKTAAMAPRIRPMPSEKKRVIWSAPTKDCQCRSASSRRNVPWPSSWRRATRPPSYERSATRRRASTSMASWSASSAIRSSALAEAGQRPGQRAGGQLDARLAIRPQALDLVHDRARCGGHQPVAGRVERPFLDGHEVPRRGVLPAVPSSSSQPGLGQQPPDVGQDLGPVGGVRRHPVDDDLQRQATLPDPARTAHGTRSA